MRASRSALAPGTSRSISLSITSGSTFFRRSAMPRRMIVVTATIEHASNGHMNRPPVAKNFQIAPAVSGSCASIGSAVIGSRKS